jgi:hypothetical protein
MKTASPPELSAREIARINTGKTPGLNVSFDYDLKVSDHVLGEFLALYLIPLDVIHAFRVRLFLTIHRRSMFLDTW